MASRLDALATIPTPRLILFWIAGAALIGAGWWFLYYQDAQAAREQAEQGLTKAKADLETTKVKVETFEEQMAQAAKDQQEVESSKRVLPLSSATVDHLMRKFQQQGRLVGLEVLDWKPGSEEKAEFYARLPVEVNAAGTWHQMGEFFRRVSEFEQIVSIERVQIGLGSTAQDEDATFPALTIRFTASTFRYLDPSEQQAGGETTEAGRRRQIQEAK
jgi:type IV pilus assembly protein PilO